MTEGEPPSPTANLPNLQTSGQFPSTGKELRTVQAHSADIFQYCSFPIAYYYWSILLFSNFILWLHVSTTVHTKQVTLRLRTPHLACPHHVTSWPDEMIPLRHLHLISTAKFNLPYTRAHAVIPGLQAKHSHRTPTAESNLFSLGIGLQNFVSTANTFHGQTSLPTA